MLLANNLNITRLGKENNILKDTYKYEIIIEKNKDLIIEDLCFIKFQKESYVQVFSLYKLNIYTRDNLI